MWSASLCWFTFLLIQKIFLNVLKIFCRPFIFYYVPCKCLCCRISGLLMASCRVGNKVQLWDILMQVQLCHPLDPVDGNTSIRVTLELVFSSFCLIQFDLAVYLNRNTNLGSPVSGPHKKCLTPTPLKNWVKFSLLNLCLWRVYPEYNPVYNYDIFWFKGRF